MVQALQRLRINYHQFLLLGLWLMLWGGLLTSLEDILALPSPGGLRGLLNGIRALLPFVAGALAMGLLLMKRRYLSWKWLWSPLGLLTLYGAIGIISSLIFSPRPLISLYWTLLYLCVLLVLWASLSDSQALNCLRSLVCLNGVIVVFVLGAILLGVLLSSGISFSARLSGFIPYLAPKEVYGSFGINANGVGRFAAVAALVSLVWLGRGKGVWRLLLVFLFAVSLLMLLLTQSRTAFYGFIAAAGLLIWLPLSIRAKFLTLAGVALLLFSIFYSPLFTRLSTFPMGGLAPGEEAVNQFSSGRLGTWQEGWQLVISRSPFIGFGFQSDRLILNQHMHNAFLQALVQTGFLGALALIGVLVWAWVKVLRLSLFSHFAEIKDKIPFMEAGAVLCFLTVRSIGESTGAFFGIDFLILAPLLVYIWLLSLNLRRTTR